MKSPKPPVSVEPIEDEPETEYILRLASALILAHAKDTPVLHTWYDEDEPVTGEELSNSLTHAAEQLQKERIDKLRGVSLHAKLIQAGGTEVPTLTFTTSERELTSCHALPFYKGCTLHITPLAR